MDKNREKTVERPQNKNLKRDAGPGRTKGRKNFKTLYYEAIEKVAQSQGITGDEFEVKMIEQAVRKGFNGDRGFYADSMDRVHGKAENTTKLVDTDGNSIQPLMVKIIGKDGDGNTNRV